MTKNNIIIKCGKFIRNHAMIEGKVEAIVVRLCAERCLNVNEIAALGTFRQSYQRLRERIRDNKKLDWSNAKHEEYRAFKEGALFVGGLLFKGYEPKHLASLLAVTANEWEWMWLCPLQERREAARKIFDDAICQGMEF